MSVLSASKVTESFDGGKDEKIVCEIRLKVDKKR